MFQMSEKMETGNQDLGRKGLMTTEKKPPFVMVVVNMKKPYGILFASHPDDDAVFETFKDLIRDEKIDEFFEILRFNITEDVHGSIAERAKL